MLSMKHPWRDLDTLERWRRESMTPAERAAEDAVERRRNLRIGVGVMLAVATTAAVTVVPWAIGAWTMAAWVVRMV